MRADNTHHLTAAARRRSKQTRQRAISALRRMDATGKPVNFDTVSREAQVSRSWLYSQGDIRAEIEQLRERHGGRYSAITPIPPHRQRATDASLLRRLEAATTRIRELEDDNQRLRDALARALGHQRAQTIHGDLNGAIDGRDTPKTRPSKKSGSC